MAIHRLITCIVKHISLSHVQTVSGKTPEDNSRFIPPPFRFGLHFVLSTIPLTRLSLFYNLIFTIYVITLFPYAFR